MCTLYAIKTRNVPENFNEAKFIGFTMYTTLVIWIAFVAIYLSNSEHKVTLLSLCISFSALFALFLLFFPKCYIIILKPDRNNRSFFTTTNQVRCHIGFNSQQTNNQIGQQQQQQQLFQRASLSEPDYEAPKTMELEGDCSGSLEGALKSVCERADQLRRQQLEFKFNSMNEAQSSSTNTNLVKPPDLDLAPTSNSNQK